MSQKPRRSERTTKPVDYYSPKLNRSNKRAQPDETKSKRGRPTKSETSKRTTTTKTASAKSQTSTSKKVAASSSRKRKVVDTSSSEEEQAPEVTTKQTQSKPKRQKKIRETTVNHPAEVYMMGDNPFGQCGQGTGDDDNEGDDGVGTIDALTLVPKGKRSELVQQVCCGGTSTFILADGLIYSFGDNDVGILGRTNDGKQAKNYEEAIDLPIQSKLKFIQMSCGDCHAVALAEDGSVWQWGCYRDSMNGRTWTNEGEGKILKPKKVDFGSKVEIRQLASLPDHTLALDSDGNVWEWGLLQHFLRFKNGAQKSDRTLIKELSPHKINFGARNIKIKKIWPGHNAIFVEREEGGIMCWGLNNDSQLGFGNTEEVFTPKLNANLQDVSEIASGGFFTLVLKNDGTLWSVGQNTAGQCGLGYTEPVKELTKIDIEPIAMIASGTDHVIAVAKSGMLYGWGFNGCGQLGFPREHGENISSPQQIPVPSKLSPHAGISGISCGANFGAVIFENTGANRGQPSPQQPTKALPPIQNDEEEEEGRESLKIGQTVYYKGRKATVRYLGPVENKEGNFVGIELELPEGRNDGSVNGKSYFKAAPNHGVFTQEKLLTLLPPPPGFLPQSPLATTPTVPKLVNPLPAASNAAASSSSSSSAASTPGFSFGTVAGSGSSSSGGFKFGATASTGAAASSTGFSFGGSTSAGAASFGSASTTTGFTFGNTTPSASSSAPAKFSFGNPSSSSTNAGGAVSFGSASTSSGFTFGGGAASSSSAASASGFTFGSAAPSGVSFANPDFIKPKQTPNNNNNNNSNTDSSAGTWKCLSCESPNGNNLNSCNVCLSARQSVKDFKKFSWN